MTLKNFLKNFLLLSLGIVALVNFYTKEGFSLSELIDGLSNSKMRWVVLATGMHLINHFLRAYRWVLLIKSRGFYTSNWHGVLAEMTGFFTNFFVPRLGELTRCTSLDRMDRVPVKESLPTVIVERTIDVFVFMVAVVSVFLGTLLWGERSSQRLFKQIFAQLSSSWIFSVKGLGIIFLMIVVISASVFFLYKLFNGYFQEFYAICTTLWYNTKSTLYKVKYSVWGVTFLIWFSFFLVEYISCFALQETSQLDFFAIFCIFIVINLGASIPIPGNVGAYHGLVALALSVFGIGYEASVVYVTITHGIQVFNAVVVGGTCYVISRFVKEKSYVEE